MEASGAGEWAGRGQEERERLHPGLVGAWTWASRQQPVQRLPAPLGRWHCIATGREGRAGRPGGRAPLACVCLARVMPACGALTTLCHLIHQIYFVSPPNPTQTATWGLFLVLNRWGS